MPAKRTGSTTGGRRTTKKAPVKRTAGKKVTGKKKAPAKKRTPAKKKAPAAKAPAAKATGKRVRVTATRVTATKKTATATTEAPTKKHARASRRPAVAQLEPAPQSDLAALRDQGRAARQEVPRKRQGEWVVPPRRRDPVETLRRSNAPRLPDIAPIRIGRMIADPFAFLRGSAVVMADDLAATPTSGLRVQACADMHLLNLGLFATPERHLVFDVNDFDETIPGPWEWDLKRLVASFEVSARSVGLPAGTGEAAVREASSAYRRTMAETAECSQLERLYARIDADEVLARISERPVGTEEERRDALAKAEKTISKARRRTSLHALGRFTDVVDGKRVIVPDPPIVQPLQDHQVALVDRFFDRYRESLNDDRRRLLEQYELVDVALKVVGVGSVGTRAFIGLLAGRPGLDPLFLQVKEALPSVFAPHVGASVYRNQGRRVVEGQRLMQAASDIFLGWGMVNKRHYYVRQLRDMKGSADPTNMLPGTFIAYGRLCGEVVARAHARGTHPGAISAYCGKSESLDDAMVRFATAYGDQTERDHEALVKAVRMGRIHAIQGV